MFKLGPMRPRQGKLALPGKRTRQSFRAQLKLPLECRPAPQKKECGQGRDRSSPQRARSEQRLDEDARSVACGQWLHRLPNHDKFASEDHVGGGMGWES